MLQYVFRFVLRRVHGWIDISAACPWIRIQSFSATASRSIASPSRRVASVRYIVVAKCRSRTHAARTQSLTRSHVKLPLAANDHRKKTCAPFVRSHNFPCQALVCIINHPIRPQL